VRLDSPSAKSYGQVTEAGWVQCGDRKEQRPALPQLKITVSTLDPLGLPLTATVPSGDKADEPLSVPESDRVRPPWQRRGRLDGGDSKLAARAPRIPGAGGGASYLCPLPPAQVAAAGLQELLPPGRAGPRPPDALKRFKDAPGRWEKIAEGDEDPVPISGELAGQSVPCPERRLVVPSLKMAEAQSQNLDRRLTQAVIAIKRLNERKQGKPRPKNQAALEATVAGLLKTHRVTDLLHGQYPVRPCGDHPARARVTEAPTVRGPLNRPAVADVKCAVGGRVSAPNAPRVQLRLTTAVWA
jgi:hypothetical protein